MKFGLRVTEETRLVLVISTVLFGVLLMAAALVILAAMHPVPSEVYQAARTLLSLGAGFASAGLCGSIDVGGGWKSVTFSATGGFAVFLVVYLIQPGIISLLGLA